MKHDVTADDSPLNPKNGLEFMNISVHVECEGKDGARMSQAEVYSDAERPRAKKLIQLGYHVPRVFRDAKFKDQIRLFRDREGEMVLDIPYLCIDVNSFTRIRRVDAKGKGGEEKKKGEWEAERKKLG